jgi:hypothetical protein
LYPTYNISGASDKLRTEFRYTVISNRDYYDRLQVPLDK